MKLYYVDTGSVLDLNQIVSYSYSEDVIGRTIIVSLSNGQVIEASDYRDHEKPLFEALLKWHELLWMESVNGTTYVSRVG